MTDFLILCDGAPAKGAISTSAVVRLDSGDTNPNLRLEIDVYRNQLQQMSRRQSDLLRIAAFVYGADNRCTRGRPTDVFGEHWKRDLRFIVPVWDIAFWNLGATKDALSEMLGFLTGDSFAFEFIQRTHKTSRQELMNFNEMLDPLPQVDQVTLFSGGADSLAAVIDALKQGRHPILVSHRSVMKIDARQRNLVTELRKRFPPWALPHMSMWVNRQGEKRSNEFSQRSRSFLFTSMGAITAALLNIDEVFLCDNGIVSINLPQSGQNVGTLLSRSTHPRYLAQAQFFLRKVLERENLRIANSLIFKTKREIVESISQSGHPELLQETVSCAHVEGKTKQQPHCGVCSQCIDRRFATVGAGLEQFDLPQRYEVDIFNDALKIGNHRTHAENYLRFALRLAELADSDAFFEAYPQLLDCIAPGQGADRTGRELHALFQRHQANVNGVIETQIWKRAKELVKGNISRDCLVAIAASGKASADPRIEFIDKLKELLGNSIPPIFQTERPKNERQVQDAGEGLFIAAREELERETPQLPFSIISTKPDFSSCSSDAPALFIEFKYVKNRARLNGVVNEIAKSVTIYGAQGVWALFFVYDPHRIISNDAKFSRPFEARAGMFVAVTR